MLTENTSGLGMRNRDLGNCFRISIYLVYKRKFGNFSIRWIAYFEFAVQKLYRCYVQMERFGEMDEVYIIKSFSYVIKNTLFGKLSLSTIRYSTACYS